MDGEEEWVYPDNFHSCNVFKIETGLAGKKGEPSK